MGDAVRVQAHAKLNALLRVLSREDSGYHGLETVFALVDLADTVDVERIDSGIELDVAGAETGPTQDNLSYRAADLMLATTGRKCGVRIHLEKRIPVQAGLGGGSSDAAATLHAVNALLDHVVPAHEMLQLAAKLGADVPFFSSGAAMALAWHHGNRLFRLTPPRAAPTLIAKPDIAVSTADAYRQLDRATTFGERATIALDAAAFGTWGSLGRLGGNDFENVVFGMHPTIRDLFERMAETRPLWVRLAGSGAAVAAVYRQAADRDRAMEVLGRQNQTLYPTMTRDQPAPPPQPR